VLRRAAFPAAFAHFILKGLAGFWLDGAFLCWSHLDSIAPARILPVFVRGSLRAGPKRVAPDQGAQPAGEDRSQGATAAVAVHRLLINSG
jgi:hypothetical protein